MQTFIPYPSFKASARALDRQRLGKQRVEVLQLLRAGLGHTAGGWANHPALRMWSGHLCALAGYGMVVCDEWIARGYRDTTRPKLWALWLEARDAGESVLVPSWWGSSVVHESHQANLVRKDPDHYGPMFPGVDPQADYVWPVTTHDSTRKRKRGTVRPVAAGSTGTPPPMTKEPTVAARKKSTKQTAPEPEVEDVDLDDVETEDVDDEPEPEPTPKRKSGKAKKAAKATVEVEVDDEDDDEDEPEAKPAPKKAKRAKSADKPAKAPAAEAPKFGTPQLAEYVNETLGTSYTPFQLRAILRRMANDPNSSLSREVGTDRARYDFTGPKDPRVKELIKRLRNGEIEADKKEQLDKLKERNAAKKAKAKETAPVEDLDEDDDDTEDDDDE